MIDIIIKGSIFMLYVSFFVGYLFLFYWLFKGFIFVLNAIFKKAKILKWVIQFFYHREEFFNYLKEKGL